MLLEILQNLQWNTSARVSFLIKLLASGCFWPLRGAMQKSVLLFCCSTFVVKFFQKKPVKEFIFSKLAGLQTATLLKNKLLHKYLSRAVTTEEGQLFCTNTSVWLLPLQAETHTQKPNNSAQLTSKPFNFNFAAICVIHYASVWSKNLRTYFQIKTVTNHFYFYFDSWW